MTFSDGHRIGSIVTPRNAGFKSLSSTSFMVSYLALQVRLFSPERKSILVQCKY